MRWWAASLLVVLLTWLVLWSVLGTPLRRDDPLRDELALWLAHDFKFVQALPWPEIPSGQSLSWEGPAAAVWYLKAVAESYALCHTPTHEPAVPRLGKGAHRFRGASGLEGFGLTRGALALAAFHGNDALTYHLRHDTAQTPFAVTETAKVHEALAQCTRQVRRAARQWWRQIPEPKPSLWLTGHGSGAVSAVLLAAELARYGGPQITVYTFGCPKIGNHAFQTWFDRQWPAMRHYRIANAADAVPALPVSTGREPYWQCGELHLVYLETGRTVFDHGLSAYARALDDASREN